MINFYQFIKNNKTINPNYETHKIELPFRALICSASGSGKTNLLMNLIYEMNKTFIKIIICTKAPEPLYDYLAEKIQNVEIHYDKIPDIEKLPKGQNGLIIYDDMVCDDLKAINEAFIRFRKLQFSSIYISQSFFKTNKLIRQNINYLWLGNGIMKRDLKTILSEFSINLSIDELVKLYNEITKEKLNFMLIDLNLRNIRKNILEIVYDF